MIYDASYAHKIRANAGTFRWRYNMFDIVIAYLSYVIYWPPDF